MRASGQRWEARAERWLSKRGLKLVERNFNCRVGEIDLIMTDQDAMVFVEVRFRSRADYGSGAESISAAKRQRIVQAARWYLAKHPSLAERVCRFDVISIAGGALPRYEWIKNAFYAD